MTGFSKQRVVVIHYHLFKNAGTSLDASLKRVFEGSWMNVEGDKGNLNTEEAEEIIKQYNEVSVFSSHTIRLPIPIVPQTRLWAVTMIRHPIDRIRSVYDFEHKQDADTLGARKAKELDFPGYVEWRLEYDHQVKNFQSFKFTHQDEPTRAEYAIRNLKSFYFVGLVEQAERSIKRLSRQLHEDLGVSALVTERKNVTQTLGSTLDERIELVRQRLGNDLFETTWEANKEDLRLWEYFCDLNGGE